MSLPPRSPRCPAAFASAVFTGGGRAAPPRCANTPCKGPHFPTRSGFLSSHGEPAGLSEGPPGRWKVFPRIVWLHGNRVASAPRTKERQGLERKTILTRRHHFQRKKVIHGPQFTCYLAGSPVFLIDSPRPACPCERSPQRAVRGDVYELSFRLFLLCFLPAPALGAAPGCFPRPRRIGHRARRWPPACLRCAARSEIGAPRG